MSPPKIPIKLKVLFLHFKLYQVVQIGPFTNKQLLEKCDILKFTPFYGTFSVLTIKIIKC